MRAGMSTAARALMSQVLFSGSSQPVTVGVPVLAGALGVGVTSAESVLVGAGSLVGGASGGGGGVGVAGGGWAMSTVPVAQTISARAAVARSLRRRTAISASASSGEA